MVVATIIVALILAGLIVLSVHDRRQTTHTILRNYPIIGYFRYVAIRLAQGLRPHGAACANRIGTLLYF